MYSSIKTTTCTIVGVFVFIAVFFAVPLFSAETNKKVYIIPAEKEVNPRMAAYIKRSIDIAAKDKDAIIIMEINTFGGRVDSALKIVDTLLSVPKEQTIAYVTEKAISAGALIALSCGRLVMEHNTTIGDCAPITYSNDGPQMLGEKFQSPLRAKFRTLAKRNSYPELLAEAMVSLDIEVLEIKYKDRSLYMSAKDYDDLKKEEKDKIVSKKTVVEKGELLTMNDVEAKDLGFSKMSVKNIDEMMEKLGIQQPERITIEENWSEALVRFIDAIAPLLLLIGVVALYAEFKIPGFVGPGIIGIICLTIVFINQYLVGLADYTELLLIVIGIICIGFELFVIPGFGIAGIAGIIFIAGGMILSFQNFVIPDPSFPWEMELFRYNITLVFGSFLFAFLTGLFLLRYVLPKTTRVVSGPYLDNTLEDSHADSLEAKSANIGDIGTAMTYLRPSGKMDINGEIFDVVTEGDFLEKGTPLIITEKRGNVLVVKRKKES